MVALPTATPVTIFPETDAIVGALLLHNPPGTASVKVVVLPVHTIIADGVIAGGVIRTVTVFTAAQPAPLV
jgi:hypothetical protein